MNIYLCKVCGHIAFGSIPENCPVCHAPKTSFEQKNNIFTESAEKSKELAAKHIPSVKVIKQCGIIKEENCIDVVVRIGEVLHPMTDNHYIMNIDCYVDDKYVSRVTLTPGVWASAVFHLKTPGKKIKIVEHCNLHGFWMVETDL